MATAQYLVEDFVENSPELLLANGGSWLSIVNAVQQLVFAWAAEGADLHILSILLICRRFSYWKAKRVPDQVHLFE